jgi:hypothetical protein
VAEPSEAHEPHTEDLLDELLEAPSPDAFLEAHPPLSRTLSDYLYELLEQKHLARSQVVRMANLNETFGYQIFKGERKPSRNKVLQIAFAMALSLEETNRALGLAGANALSVKNRRDAVIAFCLDRGCSLQKVNEELWARGEETVC